MLGKAPREAFSSSRGSKGQAGEPAGPCRGSLSSEAYLLGVLGHHVAQLQPELVLGLALHAHKVGVIHTVRQPHSSLLPMAHLRTCMARQDTQRGDIAWQGKDGTTRSPSIRTHGRIDDLPDGASCPVARLTSCKKLIKSSACVGSNLR
jgi:hypothetical protein